MQGAGCLGWRALPLWRMFIRRIATTQDWCADHRAESLVLARPAVSAASRCAAVANAMRGRGRHVGNFNRIGRRFATMLQPIDAAFLMKALIAVTTGLLSHFDATGSIAACIVRTDADA